ncbi:MAG TPA: HEAT repeat domain-containing protein [Bryobacteraceae bacterium]|nr:HEAT repeat domain-containing protein [Bryobacteraceae bacterium]
MTDIRDCIEKLASSDEADRIYAAEDIGYANQSAGVLPLLRRLREEPSRAVKESIFAALLQIEDDAVIEGALELLDSDDSFLRNQAVELLQALGNKALPYLGQAFQEGDRDRRKFVIDVIARLTDPAARDLLALALKDADLNVVITAVESVGNTRQCQFREQIESLISPDAQPMVLSACLEALTHVGDSNSVSAVHSCFGSIESLPAFLRPSYLKLVGTKGGPQHLAEIASLAGIQSLDGAVLNAMTSLRNRYPEISLPSGLAQPLMDMARRNPGPLAYQAVRLLSGLIDNRDVFEFLAHCLDHSDKVIRIGAIQAMRQAGGERSEALLSRRLDRETDEEVLQAWGGKNAQ